MRWAWLPMIGAAVVIIVLLTGLRPGARRRFSATWIREQAAPITPDLRKEVEDARWHRQVGMLVGGLVGLTVAVVLIRRFGFYDDRGVFLTFVAFLVPLVLMTVGSNVASLVNALHDVEGTVRVAHSWAPRLTDFVNRPGLVVVRIAALILCGLALAATQVPTWQGFGFGEDQSGYAWCVLAALVLIWAGSELVARRLVEQPQPSGNAIALYWRNAVRGERLGEVCSLPASLGLLIISLIGQALPRTRGPADDVMWNLLMASIIVIGTLAPIGQHLINRGPSGRHREAAAEAARNAYETV